MKKKITHVLTKMICFAFALFMPFTSVVSYAKYDYVNDTTPLVFPNRPGDISNDFVAEQGAKPQVINGLLCTSYYQGENDDVAGHVPGIFYPRNLTVAMLRRPDPGYADPRARNIKIALGVPVSVHLTWGMVDAYQNLTNTIFISDDDPEKKALNDRLMSKMPDYHDEKAFYAWQEENRKEEVAFLKQYIKNKESSAKASKAADTSSLANASVNNEEFNAKVYYDRYPDLQATIGADAKALYNHWITYGKVEGRIAK